ncbi:MAG: patatin-like phospholipase family protein [Thermoguttaceae bacterium]
MNASLCEANRHTSTVAEPRIGLVLSGGGARAAAHLGVLAVLEREFSFDCVVGTSAGSLTGLFYALGYTSAEMLALVKKELGPGLVGFLPGGAYLHVLRLMRGRLASRLLRYVPRCVRLEDFSRPRLIVTCTDLVTKRCVPLNHGSAASAVVASCSLPGVATPVLDGPMVLVDGGLVDNCPCHALRGQNVDVIVAVDASGVRPTPIRPGRTPGLMQTLLSCWEAQRGLPSAPPDARPDVTIRPDTSAYSFADFSPRAIDALAEAGRRAAEAALPQLRAILSQKTVRSASPHALSDRRSRTSILRSSACVDTAGALLPGILRKEMPTRNAGSFRKFAGAFSRN